MPKRALITRIRAEFLEMPGLQLTLSQAQRLCGGDRGSCEAALDALVDEQFLCMRAGGRYARPSDVASGDCDVKHGGQAHVHRSS